ncbi:MAG TPA: hypothetical protein VED22_02310 [Nitrososphaerales archaeon]|nr:hypothetical protein [Nitrososphaerales archaeon]
MNEDLVEEPFKAAAKRVEEAYDKAAADLKANVEKAKSEALKKVSQ